MLIRSLRIENFRKFSDLQIGEFSHGLNLVCEPNEAGKSTVLEALRAVFFERHGANSERTRSFRPYGSDVAPEVTVTFEIADQKWVLRKRFLQGALVTLSNGHQRYESDAAEDQLQTLLGVGRPGNRGADEESCGALGLLWVEQGEALKPVEPAARVKRTLEELLAGEIGAVTGGPEASAVERAVETKLAELKTATGRPRGELRSALDERDAADEALLSAQEKLRGFEDVLKGLEARRAELKRIRRDLEDETQAAHRKSLQADLERAKLTCAELRSAELQEQAARGEHKAAAQKLEQRAADRAARRQAEEAVAEKSAVALRDAAALEKSARDETARATELAEGIAAIETADAALRRVREGRQAVAWQQALARAFQRLDKAAPRAEALKAKEAEYRKNRVTDDALKRLDGLERRTIKAQAALAPQLSLLDIVLVADAPPVSLNGEITMGTLRRPVAERTEISVEGVGRFTISPASGIAAMADLRTAETELKAQLRQLEQPDIAAARAANRRRVDLAADIRSGRELLAADCLADPDLGLEAGFDALRAALAGKARPEIAMDGPDELAEAEALSDRVRQAERAMAGRRDAAAAVLRAADADAVRSATAKGQAEAILAQSEQALSASEAEAGDETLRGVVARCAANLAAAADERATRQASADALDAGQIQRAMADFDQRRTKLEEARLEHVREIATLEERADTLSEAGPTSVLAAAEEHLAAARQRAVRIEEEAAVLVLLDSTIKAARAEATRRFLAPVTARIAPHLGRLFPGAGLSFNEFAPEAVTRFGRTEAVSDLSRGTQEQIAVLTRLAFAELMLASNHPAAIVLDDALVYSDDSRFEVMRGILAEASGRVQIIVLTCRASAFRGLAAARISLRG